MGKSSWGLGVRVRSVFHSSLNGPKCRKLGGRGKLQVRDSSTWSEHLPHPQGLLIPPPEVLMHGVWGGARHLCF